MDSSYLRTHRGGRPEPVPKYDNPKMNNCYRRSCKDTMPGSYCNGVCGIRTSHSGGLGSFTKPSHIVLRAIPNSRTFTSLHVASFQMMVSLVARQLFFGSAWQPVQKDGSSYCTVVIGEDHACNRCVRGTALRKGSTVREMECR